METPKKGGQMKKGSSARPWGFFLLLSGILFPLCAAEKGASAENIVTGEKVVLRARPSSDSPVLGMVPAGTRLTLLPGDRLFWAEVRLPETVCLWVPVSCIRKKSFLVPGTPVRTGPGVFCTLAGKAAGGEEVRLYETSPGGVWRKIRPLKPFLSGYCLRRDLAPSPAGAGEKSSSVQGDKVFFQESASLEGVLFLLPEQERKKGVSRYALVQFAGKAHYVRAYLTGDEAFLVRWKDRRVKITGKRSWKEDLPRPVLDVEKVEPGWDGA